MKSLMYHNNSYKNSLALHTRQSKTPSSVTQDYCLNKTYKVSKDVLVKQTNNKQIILNINNTLFYFQSFSVQFILHSKVKTL